MTDSVETVAAEEEKKKITLREKIYDRIGISGFRDFTRKWSFPAATAFGKWFAYIASQDNFDKPDVLGYYLLGSIIADGVQAFGRFALFPDSEIPYSFIEKNVLDFI